MALLWKMMCNLGDLMSLRHPVTLDGPLWLPRLAMKCTLSPKPLGLGIRDLGPQKKIPRGLLAMCTCQSLAMKTTFSPNGFPAGKTSGAWKPQKNKESRVSSVGIVRISTNLYLFFLFFLYLCVTYFYAFLRSFTCFENEIQRQLCRYCTYFLMTLTASPYYFGRRST